MMYYLRRISAMLIIVAFIIILLPGCARNLQGHQVEIAVKKCKEHSGVSIYHHNKLFDGSIALICLDGTEFKVEDL